jgi:WD40 repeat protein
MPEEPSAPPPDEASDAPTLAEGEVPAETITMGEQVAGAVPAERPAVVIGRYKLLKELGKGGFGIVWLAEQTEPIRREVALKVIKAGMDSRDIVARFEAERQALALMDHPNIAAVLDAGTTERGLPYFVMELVKGVPITEYCDTRQLGIRERLELFIPVCQAVQHAHQKAILHRDLKPSNILVAEVDGKPVPKVIDFGIAKALSASPEEVLQASLALTQEGMVVGTPQYMSPEQAGSVPDVDTRSDLYTLGVILYELLVGETPLSKEQLRRAALDEVLRLVREGEPQRPSSRFIPATERGKTTAGLRHTEPRKLGHALRGDLDWIVLKALEKDRARRYDTANAFALDLRRHLDHEPVSAGPPSAGYRLRKLVRRNRLAFGAVTAILAMLVAGITVSMWQAMRATKAEKLADGRRMQAEAAKETALAAEQRATESQRANRKAFSLADLQRADAMSESAERGPEMLAYLARAVRTDPDNRIAGRRILALLMQRNWPLHGATKRKLDESVEALTFSPNGESVLLSCEGGLVRYLNAATLRDVLADSPGFRLPGEVRHAAFSPNGAFVLAASPKAVALYLASDGTPVATIELTAPFKQTDKSDEEGIAAAVFSADGREVAVATFGGSVTRYAVSEKAMTAKASYTIPHAKFVSYDSNGKSLFAANSEGNIFRCALDVASKKPVNLGFDLAVYSRHFAEARRSIPAGMPRYERSYEGSFNEEEFSANPIKYSLTHRVAFSPDGTKAATAGSNESSILEKDGAAPWSDSRGRSFKHDNRIGRVVFSRDNRFLVSCGYDNVARVWLLGTGEIGEMDIDKLFLTLPHKDWVTDAAFSPDGSRLVTLEGDTIHSWSLADHRARAVAFENFSALGVEDIDRITGHPWIAMRNPQGAVRIYDAVKGKVCGPELENFSEQAPEPSDRPPDENRFLMSARIGTVFKIITDPEDGRKLRKSGHVVAWSIATGKRLYEIRPTTGVNWAALSGDAKRLLIASQKNFRMYSVADGLPLGEPVGFDGDDVSEVKFSDVRDEVFAMSKSGVVRRFDATTGALKSISRNLEGEGRFYDLHATKDFVFVLFSPQRLADGNSWPTRVWDVLHDRFLSAPIENSIYYFYPQLVGTPPRVITSRGRDAVVSTLEGRTLLTLHDSNMVGDLIFSDDFREVITVPDREGPTRVYDIASGSILPIPDPVAFGPHGRVVLTSSGVIDIETRCRLTDELDVDGFLDDEHVLWNHRVVTLLPRLDSSCPDWLGTVAEIVGGLRLSERGALSPVEDAPSGWEHTLRGLRSRPAADDVERVVRWYFDHSARRPENPLVR